MDGGKWVNVQIPLSFGFTMKIVWFDASTAFMTCGSKCMVIHVFWRIHSVTQALSTWTFGSEFLEITKMNRIHYSSLTLHDLAERVVSDTDI